MRNGAGTSLLLRNCSRPARELPGNRLVTAWELTENCRRTARAMLGQCDAAWELLGKLGKCSGNAWALL
eukprot:4448889-Lingulodinium_polyedra.AAC.1